MRPFFINKNNEVLKTLSFSSFFIIHFFAFAAISIEFLRKFYLEKKYYKFIYFTFSRVIDIYKCESSNRTSVMNTYAE